MATNVRVQLSADDLDTICAALRDPCLVSLDSTDPQSAHDERCLARTLFLKLDDARRVAHFRTQNAIINAKLRG